MKRTPRIGRTYDPTTIDDAVSPEARPGTQAGNPAIDDHYRTPARTIIPPPDEAAPGDRPARDILSDAPSDTQRYR